MTTDDHEQERVWEALQERAKELQCLYEVDEILRRGGAATEEICRALIDVIPLGWQHTAVWWARITHGTSVYQPPNVAEGAWSQRATVFAAGEAVGNIDVFYTREMPPADEGPFLKEERKLIDTIAERLGTALAKRDPRQQLRAGGERRESAVLLDFLHQTDRPLLARLARRLLNYLSGSGLGQAQDLLQRLGGDDAITEDTLPDDNRPRVRRRTEELVALSEQAFKMASAELSEEALVALLQKWIKDDRSAFLIEAMDNPGNSLLDVAQALERFHQSAVDERELSHSVQTGLRASLARRFFTDAPEFIQAARRDIAIEDYVELADHVISSPQSHGRLGGKASGLFLASRIVQRAEEYAHHLNDIRVPRTWYISSDGVLDFVTFNQLQDVYNRKYLEADQIRRDYPHVVQVFKHSHFPPELAHGLTRALDDLGDVPLIVRSSSLLEDRLGTAFSGKYKSLFLANTGTKVERLAALLDAVAEVYASVLGPDPIEYRAERGLIDAHEEMGILIQEVVGRRVGPYYLPLYAGVAFGRNELRWSPRLRREDGLVRLVPGLGTRAVDRVADDYPILFSPGQPSLSVNPSPEETVRYAPRLVDVISFDTARFETIEIGALLAEAAHDPLTLQLMLSVNDDGRLRPATRLDLQWPDRLVVTGDRLILETDFPHRIRTLLRVLEERLGVPVDVEFAADDQHLYLLQCRPLTSARQAPPSAMPRDVPRERVIFTANRYVSNGAVPDLTHLVYVDPDAYASLATSDELRRVGRVVGRLNRCLPKRQFALIGPGRWGSRGDLRVGVHVGYADISNTALLVEVARRHGHYVPDVSFGTHFFQDLVESSIHYLPLYPDEPNVVFNEAFFRSAPNLLDGLVPDATDLAHVIRVIDVTRATGGFVVRVLLNADLDEAIAFLTTPERQASLERPQPPPAPREEHWRWRLQVAERIAAALDQATFGVRAVYVIGSAKNATAGPGSDIDLIVQLAEPNRRDLLDLWLDGWSRALAETNFLRTGYRADGLLDIHYVTDQDIAQRKSYASKIGAVTDAARRLPMKGE